MGFGYPSKYPSEGSKLESSMPTKITKATLNKIRPADRIYEVSDTEIVGFKLRIRPNGSVSYYMVYKINRQTKKPRITIVSPWPSLACYGRIFSCAMLTKDPIVLWAAVVRLFVRPRHEQAGALFCVAVTKSYIRYRMSKIHTGL